MTNLNKILVCFCVLCVTICIVTLSLSNYQVKKLKTENQTLQDAIKNPAVDNKGKIVYKTVTLVKNTTNFVNLSDEEKAKYQQVISEQEQVINSLYGEITQIKEVSIDLGSVTKPEIPQTPQALQQKNKKWTGLLEAKQDSVNLGVGYRVYKETSVGASLNGNAKYGIILLTRW